MKAFKEWLGQNQKHLSSYTPDEIAALAITVGFDSLAVSQWLQSQKFKGVQL